MDEPVRPDPAPRSDEPAPSSPETQIPGDALPDEVEAPDVEPATPLAQSAEPPPRLPGRRVRPPSPRVGLTIAGAAILLVVFYVGRSAIGPFVVGLVLAYLLDPPVERMARIGIPRWISVLLVYAVAVVVAIQALIVTLRPLGDELTTFIREFPTFPA
jgi:hypothetical protein